MLITPDRVTAQASSPRREFRFAGLVCLSFMLVVLPSSLFAKEGDPFHIQSARFTLDNTFLKLDLNINIDLPSFVAIAVKQGFAVPLMFEVEIFANRNYWPDKKVVSIKQSYLLHFLPMLSSYVIYDVNAGQRYYFDTLERAVRYMEVVYDYPMLDIGNFDYDREFYARTRFAIDSDELPLPLKPSIFWPSSWDERSRWYSFEMIPLDFGAGG
jgi:hypothetical protein